MISITYSGWLVILLVVNVCGFLWLTKIIKNVKDQAMVDARALADLIRGKNGA